MLQELFAFGYVLHVLRVYGLRVEQVLRRLLAVLIGEQEALHCFVVFYAYLLEVMIEEQFLKLVFPTTTLVYLLELNQ